MARMMGRAGSWLWWLGGMICAMVFGSAARAAEYRAMYGVRPRPPGPEVDEKAVTEAEKEKAGKLVDDWLAGGSQAEPDAGEREQIARLIQSFGSNDFQVREAASREIVKLGGKALGQLRAALESDDAEVRARATAAISSIRSTAGQEQVAELRKLRNAAHVVIRDRRAGLDREAYKLELEAVALREQGKAEEAGRKQEESSRLRRESAQLNQLYMLVIYGGVIRPDGPKPKYGVMRLPPVQVEPGNVREERLKGRAGSD